ncbi:hypothetical protein SK854_41315 [Lentzea sp. BCCO 10_0061]|uniref:Uncharacterized protein n=1 Tax=Lentzea sokolovensis TaxID=3095429 RepID=A0ABU4VA21_9PSEU|nr:hypothetical protein [Lentzea sp. BCCO 10_0061]MDX8148614.1 hypothetical protein [Lentzea sp. BCCO 10_0061]
MAITGRDIEHLLYTETPDPILVLHNGEAEIVAAADLGGRPGAIVVCSRSELLRRVGERDISEQELTALAAELTRSTQRPAPPPPAWPA